MRILITGANGLLGQKLVKLYKNKKDVELVVTARGANRNPKGEYVYHELDITLKGQVEEVIRNTNPDVVINAAAMTHVDQCELNPKDCWKLNVEAVDHLIGAVVKHTCFFIHLSTDFVFDGESGPYNEEDIPNPLSKYAESKLASERLLEKCGLDYAIVRTMLVYGIVPDMSRSNIILWVKKSLEEGKEIKVVNDQWRNPTLAEDVAKGCALIAEKKAKGIFNISGKELLTPWDIAVKTADFFGLNKSLMKEVDGSVFTQPAKRPPKTGFILQKARKELGFEPVSFHEGLTILQSQLKMCDR
ncbi:MAG: SDR family oxidoreductase [Bacteroidota bacterium]